jgi:type 1 glutamine amidotransferase
MIDQGRPLHRRVVFVMSWIAALAGSALGAPPASAEPPPLPEEARSRIDAALPGAAPAAAAHPRKLLIFTKTRGYTHESIPYGAYALQRMGERTRAYQADVTDDIDVFDPSALSHYDAVCLLNTTSEFFLPPNEKAEAMEFTERVALVRRDVDLKKSFAGFLSCGKGFVGIHSATDSMYNWPEYGRIIGAYFDGHPWDERVVLRVEEPGHPLNAPFGGAPFEIADEIYQFREPYSRDNLRVLLSVDPQRTDMTKADIRRADGDFAVSWVRRYGEGRVFYCSLGHRPEVFWNPTVLRHYLAGIQFALGDLPADATPRAAAAPAPSVAQSQPTGAARDVQSATSAPGAKPATAPAPGTDAAPAPSPAPGTAAAPAPGTAAAPAPGTDAAPAPGTDAGAGSDPSTPSNPSLLTTAAGTKAHSPPRASGDGWNALIVGNTLEGWLGLVGDPRSRAAMTAEERAAAQGAADEGMGAHWRVQDGVLTFDGKGESICTVRDYGDFELEVEWKIESQGDSGVYLRGSPQVQIWDPAQWPEGSGGLYNNQLHPSKPIRRADRPIGEWNAFRIFMVKDRVTVHLNDVLVTDDVVMENYWERDKPIYATGAIELQSHGTPLYFRNLRIREVMSGQVRRLTAQPAWRPLLNGKDLTGWSCPEGSWTVEDGALTMKGGGYVWTTEPFGDFRLDFEFKISPGGNSGVFFRTGDLRDPVQTGIELQVLDSHGKSEPGKHDCGAIYDCLAPSRNAAKPAGEWNHVVLTCKGNRIEACMNGEAIIDMDLDRWTEANRNPDGTGNKFRTPYRDMPRKGHIGFQDHGNPVWYRNIRIKPLSP